MAMQVSYDPASGWSATPEIPYRGTRTYLHGTDLYTASTALVAAAAGSSRITAFDVRYPRFTRGKGVFRLVEGEADHAQWATSSVRIQARTEDGRHLTGWYAEIDKPAADRRDNFEKSIVAATRLESNTARYVGEPGPPLIEIIVFLTKTLLLNLFPDGPGKWVFTALRSGDLLPAEDASDVAIVLESAVGARAACCSVMIGGRKFGDIYFGRAEE